MATTCTRCDRQSDLLFFPEPFCRRHLSDERRALLDDLDRRGRNIGVRDDAWPYGPNIDVVGRAEMVTWAEQQGLRHSARGRCLHWITRGRCGVQLCTEDRNRHRWMDHVTGWTRNGTPALLVSQPYGLWTTDIADLAQVTQEWQLDLQVNGTGWYGHGTTFVQLQRPTTAQ